MGDVIAPARCGRAERLACTVVSPRGAVALQNTVNRRVVAVLILFVFLRSNLER